MRVAMYYKNDDVRLEEMPVPEIGEDELLVKIMASGICGSDVLEWYRIKSAPKVLGHEVAGVIEKVGAKVKNFQPGQRVMVTHHVPCDECHYCKFGHHTACDTLHSTSFFPGGNAEFLRVPAINVEKGTLVLPDELSFEEGTFVEPLGCVLRGQRIAQIKSGQTVLVLGSGISGLLHIQLAKALGAKRVIATDISDYRLEAAKKFGADFAFDAKENIPEKVMEVNEGRKADAVILCTGAMPAVKQAFDSIDRGGTILFFAVPEPDKAIEAPMNDFWKNEVRLVTSYAASPNDLAEAIEVLKSKKIDATGMITHRVSLADAGQGFKLVADARDSIKVIIEPQK